MAIPAGHKLLLLSLAFVLIQTPLAGQAKGPWSGCRADSLSIWNCASYYTGKVSITSELKTADGTMSRSIVATVTGGKVTCQVKEPDAAAFEGPGMMAAEHGSTGTSGTYSVKIWCPEAEGKRPARRDSPAIDTYEQQAADYVLLEGKDTHEHPDADSANGLSGTETVAWQLRR